MPFNFLFIIVMIIIASTFILTIALIISPKLRGKFQSHQIKALRHMVDYSKEDIENIQTTLGNIGIKTQKNIIDANADNLKQTVDKTAYIYNDAIEKTVRSIKKGLTEDNIYCHHCGKIIENDSKFCKYCGKEL